jgi:hypothetical protein
MVTVALASVKTTDPGITIGRLVTIVGGVADDDEWTGIVVDAVRQPTPKA